MDYHIFFYHRGLHPFLWRSSALPMLARSGLTHNVIKGRPLSPVPPSSGFAILRGLRQAGAKGRCARIRATTRASSQMNAVSSRAMATTTLL